MADGNRGDAEALVEAGLIRANKGPGKVLANGEITQAVTVRGLKVSAGAREKIRRGRRPRRGVTWPSQTRWRRSRGLFKTPELKEKILFTLLCLLIYRIGAHVTAPGVNPVALTDFFKQQAGGLLGLYDLFTGGGLSKATVFALGIMPYISSSIFFQIAAAVVPQVEKMQKEEEGGKR